MSLVTIFRALNPADAHLVRSRLETAKFHPIITHELSSLSLSAGGILVQVPEEEAAEVREFLDSEPPAQESGQAPDGSGADPA